MSDSNFLIRLAEDDDDFILGLVPRFVEFPLPPWRKRHTCIEGIRKDLLRHLEDGTAYDFLFIAEDGGDMDICLLTRERELARFLRLTGHGGSEITGPAFNPAGDRLYFSSQRGSSDDGLGVTFEVSGPFRS